jgi:hypothetical protein
MGTHPIGRRIKRMAQSVGRVSNLPVSVCIRHSRQRATSLMLVVSGSRVEATRERFEPHCSTRSIEARHVEFHMSNAWRLRLASIDDLHRESVKLLSETRAPDPTSIKLVARWSGR